MPTGGYTVVEAENKSFGKGWMKLKDSCWHCFWLSSAGTHPHPFLLIGCLARSFAHCNRSGVRKKMLKGEKEKFR